MEILNKIKKKYRKFGIYKGIFVGSLIGFILTLGLVGTYSEKSVMYGSIASVVLIILSALAFSFMWNKKYKTLENKVLSLESGTTRLDDDRLQLIGKNLSIGENWLVYHNKLKFDFWTKDTINKVRKLNGKNIEITNNNGLRKVLSVNTSRNVDEIIDRWVNESKEFDYGSNSDNMIIEGGMNNE